MTTWSLVIAWRLASTVARQPTFESMLDPDGFLCAGFKVRDTAFRLAKCRCAFARDHPLVILDIDLITENDLCRWSAAKFRLTSGVSVRKGNSRDLEGLLGQGIHPSSCPKYQSSWSCLRRTPARSNRRLCKKLHQETGNVLGLPCPITDTDQRCWDEESRPPSTCIVTTRSSTITSFVRKSAPMVAL